MLIIGHRGYLGEKPENSLAAIKAGRRSGADILEFDVRLTRDGHVVLAHDDNLRRTHGLDMSINKSTLKELQRRTAGYRPYHHPRRRLSRLVGTRHAQYRAQRKGTALAVLDILHRDEFKAHIDKVFLSSFSSRELSAGAQPQQQDQTSHAHAAQPFRLSRLGT